MTRKRLFEILDKSSADDTFGRLTDFVLMGLIILSVAVQVLRTEPTLNNTFKTAFDALELLALFVFTVEYILRLWACTADSRYAHSFWGRLRFAFTPLAIVDLISILPIYVTMFTPLDLYFLLVFRMFRIFKLVRYSETLQILFRVLGKAYKELLVTIIALFILLVIASGIMYYIERGAQPDKFTSIPSAMWWGIVTLTTVGYGDMYPVTTLGKLLATIIALLGIGLFALPAGILSSGFIDELQRKRKGRTNCPHCGKSIE